MAIRLDPAKAAGQAMVLNWHFTDRDEKLALTLKHCTLTPSHGRMVGRRPRPRSRRRAPRSMPSCCASSPRRRRWRRALSRSRAMPRGFAAAVRHARPAGRHHVRRPDAGRGPLERRGRLTSDGPAPCDARQENAKSVPYQGGRDMTMRIGRRLLGGVVAAAAALGFAGLPQAQEKKIKIGVIYDLTGPLAGGGSELQYIGAKIMIDQLHQDGRRRGLQDRGGLCRRPEQARRRHQRGRPPDRAGKGRHGAGLLLLGAVRAGGGARRAAQEVHVDHDLHLLGGAREPNSSTCSARRPAAMQFGQMTMDFIDQNAKAKLGKDAEGPARRHHPRGRRLRRRRLQGQRGRRQEGRLQHRAEGRLFGDRARPVGAGHQAEARPAGRHLPHRLQPRHHAVRSPGARAGPEVRRADRPWRRLRRLREAEGRLGRRRQLLLQHRPDLDLAHQRRRRSTPSCRR